MRDGKETNVNGLKEKSQLINVIMLGILTQMSVVVMVIVKKVVFVNAKKVGEENTVVFQKFVIVPITVVDMVLVIVQKEVIHFVAVLKDGVETLVQTIYLPLFLGLVVTCRRFILMFVMDMVSFQLPVLLQILVSAKKDFGESVVSM